VRGERKEQASDKREGEREENKIEREKEREKLSNNFGLSVSLCVWHLYDRLLVGVFELQRRDGVPELFVVLREEVLKRTAEMSERLKGIWIIITRIIIIILSIISIITIIDISTSASPASSSFLSTAALHCAAPRWS